MALAAYFRARQLVSAAFRAQSLSCRATLCSSVADDKWPGPMTKAGKPNMRSKANKEHLVSLGFTTLDEYLAARQEKPLATHSKGSSGELAAPSSEQTFEPPDGWAELEMSVGTDAESHVGDAPQAGHSEFIAHSDQHTLDSLDGTAELSLELRYQADAEEPLAGQAGPELTGESGSDSESVTKQPGQSYGHAPAGSKGQVQLEGRSFNYINWLISGPKASEIKHDEVFLDYRNGVVHILVDGARKDEIINKIISWKDEHWWVVINVDRDIPDRLLSTSTCLIEEIGPYQFLLSHFSEENLKAEKEAFEMRVSQCPQKRWYMDSCAMDGERRLKFLPVHHRITPGLNVARVVTASKHRSSDNFSLLNEELDKLAAQGFLPTESILKGEEKIPLSMYQQIGPLVAPNLVESIQASLYQHLKKFTDIPQFRMETSFGQIRFRLPRSMVFTLFSRNEFPFLRRAFTPRVPPEFAGWTKTTTANSVAGSDTITTRIMLNEPPYHCHMKVSADGSEGFYQDTVDGKLICFDVAMPERSADFRFIVHQPLVPVDQESPILKDVAAFYREQFEQKNISAAELTPFPANQGVTTTFLRRRKKHIFAQGEVLLCFNDVLQLSRQGLPFNRSEMEISSKKMYDLAHSAASGGSKAARNVKEDSLELVRAVPKILRKTLEMSRVLDDHYEGRG